MKDLFVWGNFRSSSGNDLPYKIDADALSDASIKTLARIIADKYTFRMVHSVPTGGNRLARALGAYLSPEGVDLVVDDVLTTGASMERVKRGIAADPTNILGVVIFARGECPEWVKAFLTVAEWAQS